MLSTARPLGIAATTSTAPRRRVSWPRPIWRLIVLGRFLRGYARFARTGRTPPDAYTDMRRLYRLTNGRFNDVAAGVHRLLHPPYRFPGRAGVLGDPSRHEHDETIRRLRRDGVHRFGTRLPADTCARLVDLALQAPCRVYPEPEGRPLVAVYDRQRWRGTRYIVDRQQLHEHPDVQALAADFSLLSVAQAYLRSQPALVGACMWWSTALLDRPCDEAAQMFHFDMSQIRFMKFFFYLTDVDHDTGAHQVVRRSHRRKPRALLEDRRYDDAEIARHYRPEDVVTLTGPAGSIIAEDTAALHKGMPLRRGHRLMLELYFATSVFGDQLEPIRLTRAFGDEFRRRRARYPYVYQQWE